MQLLSPDRLLLPSQKCYTACEKLRHPLAVYVSAGLLFGDAVTLVVLKNRRLGGRVLVDDGMRGDDGVRRALNFAAEGSDIDASP
jgi:hypothetical protein